MKVCWPWLCLMPVAFLCWLPLAHPEPCSVSIAPKDPEVPYGGSVVLNCTSTCLNHTQLGWETSVRKMTEQGAGWVALIIHNITEWNLQPLCFISDTSITAKAMLHVYSLLPPEIHLGAEIVAGSQSQITCNVSSLISGSSPSDINVTLSSGGSKLNDSHGSPAVGYSFLAQPTQHGEEIVCQARLWVGQQVLNSSARAKLQVWAVPYNVNVSVAQLAFPLGANITVRCSAQGNPPPQLRWELPTNASVELLEGDRIVTVPSAQHTHNGTYRCLAQNKYGVSWGQVDILIKDPPPPTPWVLIVTCVVITICFAVGAWLLVRKFIQTS